MRQRIGLVAGWGQFPVVVAKCLVAQGKQVYCVGIVDHADPVLKDICHDYREMGVARLSGQLRHFRRRNIHCATMAGKIFKTMLFRRFGWVRQMPDWGFWRNFYPHFVSGSRDRKDDTLLGMFVEVYARNGIELAPATDFAPELLVTNRLLSKRRLSTHEMRDVKFGWELAKQMGGLDVGQSVVVKGRAVLAVEAIEGTDECIRRAGQLCPAGGFTVVKVAKPQQDMRFDVPTIGLGTLQALKNAGGRVLAVEAGKTILLNEPEVVDFADRHKISVLAFSESDVEQVADVA